MGEIWLIVKSLVLSIAVVMLMQVRVGGETVEQQTLAWIHTSGAVEVLQDVAAGGIKAFHEGVEWVQRAISGGSTRNSSSHRGHRARSSSSETVKEIGQESRDRELSGDFYD